MFYLNNKVANNIILFNRKVYNIWKEETAKQTGVMESGFYCSDSKNLYNDPDVAGKTPLSYTNST